MISGKEGGEEELGDWTDGREWKERTRLSITPL